MQLNVKSSSHWLLFVTLAGCDSVSIPRGSASDLSAEHGSESSAAVSTAGAGLASSQSSDSAVASSAMGTTDDGETFAEAFGSTSPHGSTDAAGESTDAADGGVGRVDAPVLAGPLASKLEAVADLDAAGFAQRTNVAFEPLDYDPLASTGLDVINASSLGLSEAELAKFQENGFVISTQKTFPHFAYGYASIYLQDLPLYITADSILYALHTSYDEILKRLEEGLLLGEVSVALEHMRTNLADAAFSEELRADLDVYLTVAYSLNVGQLEAPLDPVNAAQVEALYADCVAAGPAKAVRLFGEDRELDFSQFKPRGHYTDTLTLRQYFRAMIWMGRLDLRLVEADPSGATKLNRHQAELVVALRTLMDDDARQAHAKVDAVVTAFVGEHDYMTPLDVDRLLADLHVDSFTAFTALDDSTIEQTIRDGKYGSQRIASQIMSAGLGGTAPLPAAFALFGQRYVFDSHVFSNVVFDRVLLQGKQRMMPSPLDVAYAALRNDQAGMMLQPELETFDYASDLASMRVIADAEPEEVWTLNLYNRWLHALQSLSPATALTTAEGETLPSIAKTEAWGRRILNTQLASWAELRHDTILYTKQSYTSAGSCEYPDAYVDPYPTFFTRVADFARHALDVLAAHGIAPPSDGLSSTLAERALWQSTDVLQNFVRVGDLLAEMATHERTGAPLTEEHLAFVNQAVHMSAGCGPETAYGWYGSLFINGYTSWAPTIADVHTQPTDEAGADVGRVLHVGTGNARLMVASIETCSGPRAYAGLVSSYYEQVEDNWTRLDDLEWEDQLHAEIPPQSPPWVLSLTTE